MRVLSNVIASLKKSKKLRKLQLRIAPPGRTTEDVVSDFMSSLGKGPDDKETALAEYFEFCLSDEGVKKVMETEGLSRSGLKDIYNHLIANGLGQWIKGHYAALSTLAYAEPLAYFVKQQKQGTNWRTIIGNLLLYWENEIPQGGLLKKVQ